MYKIYFYINNFKERNYKRKQQLLNYIIFFDFINKITNWIKQEINRDINNISNPPRLFSS